LFAALAKTAIDTFVEPEPDENPATWNAYRKVLSTWACRGSFDLMIDGCPDSIYAAVTDLQTVKDRDLNKW